VPLPLHAIDDERVTNVDAGFLDNNLHHDIESDIHDAYIHNAGAHNNNVLLQP